MIPKLKSLSKYTAIFLAGVITATAGSAYGASLAKSIKASLNPNIKVSVNGKQIDATPIIYDNTTYLPLRKAAEAVGGKIELGNGNKSINIVTDAKTGGSTTGTSGTGTTGETETYPIEGKVVYEWRVVNANLRMLQKTTMLGTVINGRDTTIYNNIKYVAIRNTDYYYDPENDKRYYSEEFLLQFLSKSDLESLTRYKVEVATNTVTSIKTEASPIESKVLYEWYEINHNLRNLERNVMISGVVNGEFIINIGEQRYVSVRNTDFYYDFIEDRSYYSSDFLLQFLLPSDLEGLTKYKLKLQTNTVTPI